MACDKWGWGKFRLLTKFRITWQFRVRNRDVCRNITARFLSTHSREAEACSSGWIGDQNASSVLDN